MDLEQELVKKAQSGDRQALGELWDNLTPKLFGYLINTLKDKALAEDLLQTTWVKAIDALPRFQSRGKGFSAWVFAIAHNECRQYWRRGKFSAEWNNAVQDPSGDDREVLDNKIMIEQALNLLSEDDRELLRLRYIADLPISEVAKILNINSVTARVRLHRAVIKVRELLK